jgi:hypothetical protein
MPSLAALARTVAAVLLTLIVAPASAQDVVRRVTIGEYYSIKIVEAIQAQQRAARAKAEFNADIAAARDAFLRNRGNAAAEKRFAELLLAKDQYYFAQMAIEGTSDYSQKRVAGINLVTGGALDGGIAPPAEDAFLRWVQAVRRTLGVRSDREMLIVTDSARVNAAIAQHEAEYTSYRALRDRHEIESFELAERVNRQRAALTPESKQRLDRQEVKRFDPVSDLRGSGRPPEPLWQLASKLAAPDVLRCRYGPVAVFEDGQSKFEEFRYWHRQPPTVIDDLIAANTNGHLGDLATRSALSDCPATSAVARSAAPLVAAPAAKIPPGDYTLEGAGVSGRGYRGQCNISTQDGGSYLFRCKGRAGQEGIGTAAGNIITVAYTGWFKITYELGSDGRLVGTWGGGAERLTPTRAAADSAEAAGGPRPSTATTPEALRREKTADRRCEMKRVQIDRYREAAIRSPSGGAAARLATFEADYAQSCGT